MINSILQSLKERGILETSNLAEYEYYYNNRANINLFLCDKKAKKTPLFIKISDGRNFELIYKNMTEVFYKFPQIIPEPLCCLTIGKYQALVMRAYNVDLLTSKSLLDIESRKLLLQVVLDNLEKLQLSTIKGHIIFNEEYCNNSIRPAMKELFCRWNDVSLSKKYENYLKKLTKYFGTKLPCIPQHGDLVVLNIGLIDGEFDKMVFIDWDNYAEINLPMYDILIFLGTFVKCYGEDLYSFSEFKSYVKQLFSKYCNKLGMDKQFAIDLYPLCLLFFASSKNDIGVFLGQQSALNEMERFFKESKKFFLNG